MHVIFLYLAWMNAIDGILTQVGLYFSRIKEGNILMKELYNVNPYLFLIFKFILSFFLYLFFVTKFTSSHTIVKACIYGSVTLYGFVMLIHAFWLLYSAFLL